MGKEKLVLLLAYLFSILLVSMGVLLVSTSAALIVAGILIAALTSLFLL